MSLPDKLVAMAVLAVLVGLCLGVFDIGGPRPFWRGVSATVLLALAPCLFVAAVVLS